MEPIRHAQVVWMDDPSRVAEARRAARTACERLGLTEEETGRAELVTVELANNILQHAGTVLQHTGMAREGYGVSSLTPVPPGRLFFSSDPSGTGVQILALDQGRGMASVQRCLEDGFSTGSTPGFGLGAVQRLAGNAEVYSSLGKGTVVAAAVGPLGPRYGRGGEGSQSNDWSTFAALSTALHGETLSGDNWVMQPGSDRNVYMVVDGLGHGLYASEAAGVATQLFLSTLRQDPRMPLPHLIEQMHAPMRATRGAAVAVVSVEEALRRVTCCGIGNVSCSLQLPDGRSHSLVSHNGTLGHQMRHVQAFEYTYDKGALLVMHSDGLSTHWKMTQYPDLAARSPVTIAGVLYRDSARERDDATILVARLN